MPSLELRLGPLQQSIDHTGLVKQFFFSLKLLIFPYSSDLTYVVGAQKNRLIETVLLSTHNMFG